jgi:hypothetical protein
VRWAGFVDEIVMHLVPLVLGGGARLFDRVGRAPVEFERTQVIEGPDATHLRFRVVRLFDGGTIPAGLELIDSTTSSTGVVINRYRRAADIRYGSFAVDERGGVEALWTEGEKR